MYSYPVAIPETDGSQDTLAELDVIPEETKFKGAKHEAKLPTATNNGLEVETSPLKIGIVTIVQGDASVSL